jgi:hypothetical protein
LVDVLAGGAKAVYQLGCHAAPWPWGCGDGDGTPTGCGLINPDFEDFVIAGRSFGWGLALENDGRDARAAMALDLAQPQHGRHALRVVVPPSTEPLVIPFSSPPNPQLPWGLQLHPNLTYNISLYLRSMPPGLGVWIVNGTQMDTQPSRTVPVPGTQLEYNTIGSFNLTSAWRRYEVPIRSGAAVRCGSQCTGCCSVGALNLLALGTSSLVRYQLLVDNIVVDASAHNMIKLKPEKTDDGDASVRQPPDGSASFVPCPDYLKSPSDACLSLQVGQYRLLIQNGTAWTFRELWFGDVKLLTPTGFSQPVINFWPPSSASPPSPWPPVHTVNTPVIPRSGHYLGSGHGGEYIFSVELHAGVGTTTIVDLLQAQPPVAGLPLAHGTVLTVIKRSQLGPYVSEQNTTLAVDGLHMAVNFTSGFNNSHNVGFMYPCMTLFNKSTEQWIAATKNGTEVRGRFKNDSSFSLAEDIRWSALWAPSADFGAVYQYPSLYHGKSPFFNSWWNRVEDNKLYFQIVSPTNQSQLTRLL